MSGNDTHHAALSFAEIEQAGSRFGTVDRVEIVGEPGRQYGIIYYKEFIDGSVLDQAHQSLPGVTNVDQCLLWRERRYQLETIQIIDGRADVAHNWSINPSMLNVDCWLEIFGSLDLVSLASVARCSTSFRTAADNIFLRKYRTIIDLMFGELPWISLTDAMHVFSVFGPQAKQIKMSSSRVLLVSAKVSATMAVAELWRRFLQPININSLDLNLWHMTPDQFGLLAEFFPRFVNLEDVCLVVPGTRHGGAVYEVNFANSIRLSSLVINGNVVLTIIANWQSLWRLTIINNFRMPRISVDEILNRNRQITVLNIHLPLAITSLNVLLESLVGFEQTLTQLSFSDEANLPYLFSDVLVDFQSLTVLSIASRCLNVRSMTNADKISQLRGLTALSLRQLPIQWVNVGLEFLQRMTVRLVHLESFTIRGLVIFENGVWELYRSSRPNLICIGP